MSKNGHCYSRETIFDTTVWILQVSTTGQVSFGSPVTSSMSGSIPRDTGPPFIAVNWYQFQTYSNSSYNKGRVYYRSTTSGRVCCYKFPSWIVSLWLLMLSHRPTYYYTGYRIQWRRYTLGRARSNENDLAEELPPCLPPWLTNTSMNFKPVYVNKNELWKHRLSFHQRRSVKRNSVKFVFRRGSAPDSGGGAHDVPLSQTL